MDINIGQEVLKLIKEVAGLKMQVAAMWKFFIGVGVVVVGNFIVNITVHWRNGKNKYKQEEEG